MTEKALAKKLAGRFLVFDGIDGCGKSRQREMLGELLERAGGQVVHCRDPGGTVIGDRIRHVLLDYDLSAMDARCEALLFMASRAQLVGEKIEPALKAGKIVLCDRYISSTCAYQGAAGYEVKTVIDLGRLAVGDVWPDLTFVFDVTVKASFARTNRKTRPKVTAGQTHMFSDARTDAMEARPKRFHEKVRRIMLSLPEFYPKPVRIIDGSGDPAAIHQQVLQALGDVFG
jgi:dTMP kinase